MNLIFKNTQLKVQTETNEKGTTAELPVRIT